MAGSVGEFVSDSDSQEALGAHVEKASQFVRPSGIGVKERLFEKRRALFERTEGGAALVKTETQQKRLPVLGTHDDPAPGIKLERRVGQEQGLEASRVLETGSMIVSSTTEELLAGEGASR